MTDSVLRDLDRRLHGHIVGDERDWDDCVLCNYSRSVRACAEVKAWLREHGVEFSIHHFTDIYLGEQRVNVFDTWFHRGDAKARNGRCGRKSLAIRTGRTEEEAVARFALAVVDAGLIEVKA